MMKRLLTFALSVGFFIWLPNAFADGNGILSLDAPSHIRQTQNNHKDLLTLRVDNIQVRAEWRVDNAAAAFDIADGVLQLTATETSGLGTQVVTIYVEDKFDLLNDSYVNLTASAVITVEFESGEFGLSDAPRLTAVAGEAGILHNFSATGGSGEKTYTLVAGDESYFSVDAGSGVLSLLAAAQERVYTLTVQAIDGRNVTVDALATVEVSAALMLSDAPLLSVALGATVGLHKFIASGGIGRKTYILTGEDKGYFSVDASSGVLSLLAGAQEGVYTLTVQAIDGRNVTVDALATVEVSAALMLLDAPSFTVIASVGMNLHTLVANGGIGTPTYTILDGNNAGHFALDAASGVLSLHAGAEPRAYVLMVLATDEHDNIAEAVVTVGVSAALSLADAQRLVGAQGVTVSLHTFVAQGGIGSRTYTLLTDNVEDYFSLDAESGVLSLLASATLGIYTLSVQVIDDRGNAAYALAMVEVRELFLASAGTLYAIEGRAVSLHTFAAQGGTDVTYTLVAGDKGHFTLGRNNGVLSVLATAPIGIYTLSVQVEDSDDNHANATAIVEVRASLSLVAMPPLTVIVGRVAHTLAASGGIGTHTYAILSGNKDGFALDAASGVLSLSVNAALGRHTLTFQVADERKNTAKTVATVEVSAALSLADAPPFTVIASVAMSLHMFIASGGIGIPTYAIVSGDESYFSVNASSGVLSLAADAEPDIYVLSIQAKDARGNTDEAVATVGVLAALSLADAPRLTAVAGEAVSLHTFSAKGGIGAKTYTLMPGDSVEYFALAESSGVLSLQASAQEGLYTLTVQVADGDSGSGPVGALATVEVSAALMLADAPLLSVVLGAAVSLYKFTASGGIGIKTYTLAAGDKGYFSVDASSGVLSLLATAQAGVHMVTVQAIDEGDRKVEAVATVRVSAALMLADAPPFTVIASVAMSLHTFIASGGIGTPTYTILASNEKGGFTLNAASGVLSLQADAAVGIHTLTVQVMDARANTAQAVATVEVSAALALAAAPSFTVIASVGMSLHMFIASGGIGTPTYTILASNEGRDFTLNATSGVLSLSVNAEVGSHTLTVQVMDARNNTAQAVVTVEVSAALALADAPSFTVVISAALSLHTFIASGGIGTPTYTIVSGNEKGGFTLNAASGVLSLQADAEPDTYVLRIQAMDARDNTAEALVTVGVSAVLSLADAPRLGGAKGTPISLYIFEAQGGIGARTYTLLTDDVEDYFSLGVESGVLSLLASATVAIYTLSVQVKDDRGNVANALATVGVGLLFLSDAQLYAIVGREVSLHTFDPMGVDGTLTYTIERNDYFSLDEESGVLSVKADAPIRIYTLSVSVSDGSNSAKALAVVEVRASLSLVAMPPLTVIVGKVAHTLAASGGIGTHTYTIVSGDEDGGFALDAASGVLSLRVDAALGQATLTLQVADARANTVQAVATVEVSAALSLAEVSLLEAIAGNALSLHAFVADGGIGSRTYTLLAGNDKYFSVGAGSGVLSLSANAAVGRYTLTVQVMDERGNTAQALATVGVSAVLSLAEVSLLEAIAGNALSLHAFVADGGIGSRTYTLLAGNDEYFSVDAGSGVLSLSANAEVGRHTLTVQVMDESGNTVQAVATVEVSAALALSEVSLLEAIAGNALSLHTFVAGGGIGSRTYTLLAGNDGYFSVGAESGVLSLSVNAEVGRHTLTVQVMDERGNTAQAVATVGVSAVLSLAEVPLLEAIVGNALSLHAFVADGGIGSRTYTLLAGDKDYFSVDASSGVLSLSANAEVRRHTLTVQVMDERGNTAQAVAMVGVSAVLALAKVSPLTIIVGDVAHTLVASGGVGVKTYTITGGDEKGYFALDAISGVLSLSANAPAKMYTLTVRATDERNNIAELVAMVEVSAVLALADAPSFTVIASVAMSLHTFVAGGGIGSRVYTLAAGDKEYFSVNATSGVLSLLADAEVGRHTLTVQVMDERGSTAQAVAMVEVSAALSLAEVSPLTIIVGDVAHTLVASGGIGVKTYTITGGDEEGYFALDVISGVLSLSANAPAKMYTLTVRATDERNNIAEVVAMVEVSAALALAAAPSFTVIASVAMSLHTFIASGGIGSRTYTLLAGDEGYFSVGADSGVLSLTVDAAVGSHTLTVQVMDARNNTAQAVVMVEVSAVLVLAEAPSFTVIISAAMSLHTFIASGGIGTPTYTIVAGNEKRGFTLNAASGLLSLQADAEPDTYVLTVQVMDARDNTAETVATVGVSAVLALANAPRLGGSQGTAISLHMFEAQGGIGARTYTLLTDDVEGYFSLGTASGVLSLLASATVGVYTLSVQVRDDRGNVANALATVGVDLLFLSDALLYAVVGREVSLHTFAAKGVGTLTYTIEEGNDDYFSLDAKSGVLSVRATAAIGIYTLSVQVEDADNRAKALVVVEVRASLSLVAMPPLTVIVGEVAHTLTASGGIETHTYAIVSGDEDGHFALGAASGVLSLQADAALGRHTLTLQVADARANTVQAVATVEVSAVLALVEVPPFTVIASVAMSLHTFVASGGIGSRTYTLLAGDDGYFSVGAGSGVLSLSADAAVGRHTLTVQVMDGRDNTAQAVVTVGVSAALVLADAPLLEVFAGDALSLHTFVADGGIGSRTYTLLAGDDGYFSVGAESGVLSLSANAAVGRHTLTVQVMDGRGNTAQAVAMVGVSAALALAAPPFTVIASAALSLHTFIASGGIGIRTYSLLASDDDGYFSVDAASGVFSLSVNTPVKDYRLTVQVIDERGSIAQAVATVGVSVALVLAEAPPFTVIATVAVSLHTFVASGGIGTPTYAVVSGNEAGHFTLNATSGLLSLQADAEPDTYVLRIQAMDAHHNTAETMATVGVSAVLSLADAPRLGGAQGIAFSLYTFAAQGGIGSRTYTLLTDNVEDYFSLDAESGVLSLLTVAPVATYTLSVQVKDERGNVADALATVGVVLLFLADAPPLYAVVGREVSLHTFAAKGVIGTLTYTIAEGDVNSYFNLDVDHGVLSVGADAPIGIYTLSVSVSDERSSAQALAVVAVEASLFLADAPSLGAIAGITMSVHTFAAGGGIGAKTYTLAAAGQEYFALDAASGVLSAVNASLGVYTLLVTVSDSRGNQAQARGTVEVVGVLSLADVSLDALARLSVTVTLHTFTAGGGYGAKRYEMIADESGYFAFDEDSGELSLPNNVAMRAGAYALSVAVSDSLVPPQRATSAVMVRIVKNGIFVLGGNENQTATNDLQNDVWWSADGESWRENTSSAGWTARENHQVVAYRGRMYLMGGFEPGVRNDVWSSVDGKNWSLVTGGADWTARGLHQALVHNGRMYVLGGKDATENKNDVWSSADGENWKEETGAAAWSARQSHQAVSHNGRLYVMGGNDGSNFISDVWSSADGANWRFEGNAEWTGRWLYKAVSHNGRLYVLGGNDGSRLNDVWSSVDGRSWVPEKDASWAKRGRYQALSRDGLLYVLGGNTNGTNAGLRKDVWSSSDGKSWSVETAAAGWGAREYHQAVVFPSPLILWGAGETITLTLQVSAAEVYTVTAQYGFGAYTYSSTPENIGFNIDRNGVLSTDDSTQAGAYVITLQVEDEEGSLAQTRIEIEVLPVVSDAPSLFAIVGKAENLHTFVARDQARTYTYTMVSGNGEGYFTLGAASGLLSVSGEATAGLYTLSVEIGNSENYRATARATVEIRRLLSLAEALSLTATVGQGGFHTFAAQDGIGPYTYTLLSGNDLGYFVLDESSGSLSLKAEATAKLYTLTVQVSDSRGNQAQALAVVRGLVFLSWSGLPPLTAIARLSVEVTLHVAVVHGAVGTVTYALAAGNGTGYFAFDADSGVLSLPVNGARLAGDYTLSLAVSDGAVPPHQVTAAVMVRLVKNGFFVLGGNDGGLRNDVWWSADGEAWKRETANAGWTGRTDHQAAVYQGRLYVLGGIDGSPKKDVWSSADGKNWVFEGDAAWSARSQHQVVAYQGRLYVLGGLSTNGVVNNDVWSWAKGEESWKEETGSAAWTVRRGHQAVVHNGRMYVVGGNDSTSPYQLQSFLHDVWSSADGANWSLVSDDEYRPRVWHEAVSHQGRMYILGGRIYTAASNNVASSLDGKSWRDDTSNGNNFWSKRGRFGALSRDGLLYVLGGNGSPESNREKDVWSSADGRSWTKVTDAAWSARQVKAVVFPSPLILSGTSEKINLILGVSAEEVYTVTAQYGFGAYTYSLTPENIGFNIDRNGVLSTDDSIQAGVYVIAVQVEDEEGSLAQTRIEIEVLPLVPDAPALFAIVGKAENLHTFVARDQAATYTYTIVSGDGEGYFTVGAASGLLSVSGEATVGLYTLSVEISDSENYRATARATVDVRSLLSLAEALSLTATVGQGVHTFAAQGGIGAYTYTLLSGNDMGYFVLGESSGKLLLKTEADAGLYTLTVQVNDSRGSQVQALAVVRALVFLNWSGLPPLPAIARLSVEVPLHTAGVHGTIGTVTYALVAGNDTGYFAFDADSGVLSLPVNEARLAGDYTLLLAMSDSAVPPHQATAAVVVRLVKNAIFVMGGNDPIFKSDMWWSVDGKAWKGAGAGWPARRAFQAVAYQGRLYVLGGRTRQSSSDHNDVWSTDGVTWLQDKANNNDGWSARRGHQAVVHNDRMYVLGGGAGSTHGNDVRSDVWSSADGVTWSLVTGSADWPARKWHQAVAHNGRIYVLGGYDGSGRKNDVWSSADGSSWRFEGNADWDVREYHQAVSHQGRLYILGGQKIYHNDFNDVWSSLDGKSWRRELADGNNFWLKRHGFGAVSRDGLLYVLGGARGWGVHLERDVWSSADGRSWTKVGNAGWSARREPQAAVFPSPLALPGIGETITLTLQVKSEIYPFSARYGFGEYTYSLLPKVPGFSIDGSSGVLRADGSAAVGGHTLTVQVEDEEDSRAQTAVNIEVISVSIAALELADAPSFTVIAGVAMSLHTFIASGGLGAKTYTLVAGEEAGIFMLDAKSGVLSVVMNAPAGVYTLSVQVSDSTIGTVQVGGTVEVVAPLSLLPVPPLTSWLRLSAAVALHMLTASGGYEAKTYTIIAGNEMGYFAVGESSGRLSLLVNGAMLAGNYTLSVAVSDGLSPPQRATAAVTVRLAKHGIFVLGGNGGSGMNDVWSSVDGAVWMQEKADNNEFWPARDEHQVVAHNGRLYVLGGHSGGRTSDVWSSVDGKTWTEETAAADWPSRQGHQALVHNGRMYVLGGQSAYGRESDVWSSVDGKTWTEETAAAGWSGRYGHQAVAYNGRLYVLGGFGKSSGLINTNLNDVWSSVDGKNWTLEKEHNNAVGWVGRTGHQVVSHNGRMYVLGGQSDGGRTSDVWSSVDGKSWRPEKENDSNGWTARYRHQVVSRYGEMYVLGGNNSFLNDVWSSSNGKSWQPKKANNAEGWSGREYHQAIVFPPTLLLSGQGEMNYVVLSISSEIHTFQAQYGFGQYTYSLTPDVPGFDIDKSSGLLSADGGASIGSYTLTVWVQDEEKSQAQTAVKVDVALSIGALVLADAPSLMAVAGVTMSLHTFIASGGIGAKTYNLVGEPGYFALGESSGILAAQAVPEVEVYTLSVEVSDGSGKQATARATVEVVPFLLADVMLYAIVGREVSLHIFETEGGSEAAKTYAIVDGNDDYFTLDASGVLSAKGNATVGIYTLFVAVDGEGGYRAEAQAVVAVEASLFLAEMPLLTAVAGMTRSLHTFAATGGIGAKTYTLAAAEGQEYFTLNATSGVLSVVNAAMGEYTLTVRVEDGRDNSITAVVMVEVSAALVLADAPLLLTVVGEAGNLHTFAATGGIGDKTYTIAAGNEDYFNLDPSSGVLSMKVNALAEIYTLSVQAADAEGNVVTALATVEVVPLLLLDVMLYAIEGREVSLYTFEAGGGSGVKTYTIVAGNEAKYFTLDAGSGVLSVQSSVTVGIYTLSMQVTDADDNRAEALAVVAVEASLFLADMPLLVAFTEMTMSLHTFAASGGIGAKTYTIAAAGDGADYFILNATSGVLSVANAAAGVYTLSVTVSDSRGNSAQARGTVEVFEVLSLADALSLGALARLSVEMTLTTFAASGGYGAKRYTMIADESGYFAFDADSGELSLPQNPAMLAGEYTLSVAVADSLVPPQRVTAAVVVRIGKNGIFVMGGRDGGYPRDVWFSLDGKNWLKQSDTSAWPGRYEHQVASHQGRLYLMGGFGSGTGKGVWSSAAGKSWSSEGNKGWLPRWQFQVVEYKGRLYAMGGTDGNAASNRKNDVWSSADGKNWVLEGNAAWSARHGHQVVVHNGRMYLLGGLDGSRKKDVWSSADGSSWSFEGNANWPGRFVHQAVSHQGRLYVLGGRTPSASSDAWSWAVGEENWIRETSNGWPARDNFQAVSYDGLLYVMGGNIGTKDYYNDVWSSADGKKWTIVTDGAGWAGRGAPQAVVFPPSLVIWGVGASEAIILTVGVSAAEIYKVTAQYGLGPYTYSLTPENIGIKIDGDGVLSLGDDQTQAGIYAVTVRVEDKEGSRAETIINNIEIRSIALADAPLLFASAGLSEAVSLHAFIPIYGVGAPTYELVEDDSGYFTLGAASGVLSVQANVPVGVYTVSVQVSDEGGQATAVATVTVVARLSLADASLIAVEKKAVSLHTFAASGGIGSRTYTLLAGNETGYFVLDASGGVLSLSSSASAGEYTLMVGVKDERGNVATAVAVVNIAAALSLADAPPLTAAEGDARDLHTFAASGGLGVKTYTLAAGAAYFTVGVASGVLSVDENATVGMYTLSVRAEDADGNVAALALATVEVVSLLLLDAPMLYAIVGREVSLHTFEAGGGGGAKTYTIVAGDEDKYFTLDANSGVLSVQGKATVGIYTLTVEAKDEDGNRVEGLAVVAVEASLFLADAPSLVAVTEITMSVHTFAASGGIGAKTYILSAAEGQEYFTLNATSGVLSAVNAALGVYTLSVTVSDSRGNSAQARGTVEVLAFLSLADAPLLEAVAGMTMSVHTFVASDGIGAKTYTLAADSVAGYFAINATSGVLSVVNAAVGVYILSVTVSDSRGNSVQARATVKVSSPMSLADAPRLEAVARLSVTVALYTFAASDGIGSKRYTVIAGNEADYFALDAASGKLSLPSNSAMLAGAYTLRVGVLDGLTPPQRATAVATVHIARNGIFVMGGVTRLGVRGDVWRSANGKAWNRKTASADWPRRSDYQAAAYQGRLYVLGGSSNVGTPYNDVWSSADGKTWRRDKANNGTGWTARQDHQAVVHNGRLYVMGGTGSGGRKNDVWSWAEGEESWKEETGSAAWTVRQGHQAVSHNGRLYVLGGEDDSSRLNDVWSSADGSSWRFEGNADWEMRVDYQAVSHMGRLYVLGGNDGHTRNDVWSSLDGKSWQQEKANNGNFWGKRRNFQALSRDGLLYVLGGHDGGYTRERDVWSSADGKSWTKVGNAAWDARLEFQAVVLPPNLVLPGTSETITLTLQAAVAAVAIHTVSAQYGGGQYTYSLPSEIGGFSIENTDSAGVLSVDNQTQVGTYEVTVRVEDEEGGHAETIIKVDIF